MNCTNEWCLDIPKQSEGINSGCLVLNLPRFRAWNATFCRNGGGARPWWACVLEQWRNGYLFQGGDNGVWNTLLALHPEVWRPLPCGTHASVGVLRGLARVISEREGLAPLCDTRPTGSRTWYATNKGFPWGAYDTCEHPVVGADPRLGAVPRAEAGGVQLAIAHGAARLQPLAALVATLWATRSSRARRATMATFPCWCLSFVGSDDMQVGHELPAPRPTGCRQAARALRVPSANLSRAADTAIAAGDDDARARSKVAAAHTSAMNHSTTLHRPGRSGSGWERCWERCLPTQDPARCAVLCSENERS